MFFLKIVTKKPGPAFPRDPDFLNLVTLTAEGSPFDNVSFRIISLAFVGNRLTVYCSQKVMPVGIPIGVRLDDRSVFSSGQKISGSVIGVMIIVRDMPRTDTIAVIVGFLRELILTIVFVGYKNIIRAGTRTDYLLASAIS